MLCEKGANVPLVLVVLYVVERVDAVVGAGTVLLLVVLLVVCLCKRDEGPLFRCYQGRSGTFRRTHRRQRAIRRSGGAFPAGATGMAYISH